MATDDPEQALAIGYAEARHRAALATLLDLDRTLGGIVRTTREPLVGQMRLTWWYETLSVLDPATAPPAHPLIAALHARLLPLGIDGPTLAGPIDGWEMLLTGDLDDPATLDAYARDRGGRLFAMMARIVGAADATAIAAGEGWALADLARHVSDPNVADRATAMAADRFATAFRLRWPRRTRAIAALALIGKLDLDGIAPGSPRRALRLLRHRLTGR